MSQPNQVEHLQFHFLILCHFLSCSSFDLAHPPPPIHVRKWLVREIARDCVSKRKKNPMLSVCRLFSIGGIGIKGLIRNFTFSPTYEFFSTVVGHIFFVFFSLRKSALVKDFLDISWAAHSTWHTCPTTTNSYEKMTCKGKCERLCLETEKNLCYLCRLFWLEE